MTTAPNELDSPSPLTAPPPAWRRWAVFMGILIALTWAFIAMPSLLQSLLGLAVLASTSTSAVILWRRAQPRVNFPRWWREFWLGYSSAVLARLTWVLGLALMGLSTYLLRPYGLPDAYAGAFSASLGGICLGYTWIYRYLSQTLSLPSPQRAEHVRPAYRWTLAPLPSAQITEGIVWRRVCLGVLGLALLIQSQIFSLTPFLGSLNEVFGAFSVHLQWALLFGGAGLISLSLAGAEVWHSLQRTLAPQRWGTILRAGIRHLGGRARWTPQRLGLVLILGIALGLRLYDLELWMTRWLDEIHYANAIARLWFDPVQVLVPFSPVTSFSWLYPYWQALLAGIVGPSFTGVRLLSALMGVLQVAAVFALARTLFPQDKQGRIALTAALVCAVLPVHLQFSRIGIANIADPVFGTLALAALFKARQSQAQAWWAVAGFTLGLTQYFYEGGRLFFPLFALLLIAWWALWAWRPTLRHLAVFGACFASLATPLYYTWTTQSVPLTPRYSAMGQFNSALAEIPEDAPPPSALALTLESIAQRLGEPWRALVQAPDLSWFYGGQSALLLLPLVPFFLIGLARTVFSLRQPQAGLIFWWLAGTLVGIALISDIFSAPRYLVLVPPLCLVLAWGLVSFSEGLAWWLRREAWVRPILLSVAAGLALVQVSYYFAWHMPNFYLDKHYAIYDHTWTLFKDTEDAMLRGITQVPPLTTIHIVSRDLIWNINADTLSAYFRHGDEVRIVHVFPEDFSADYLREQSKYLPHAFFIEPENQRAVRLLKRHFIIDPAQDGLWSPYDIPPERQMQMYFAPAYASLSAEDGVQVGE